MCIDAIPLCAPVAASARHVAISDRRSLRRDEGGAVMVLGIFMCAIIVGMLWYLAGLGDAILYRQRMQEAADATAFSNAVLHARGMNLIVLINLLMAAILAVRVALKMLQTILTVTSTTLTILGSIPPGPWNPLTPLIPALQAGGQAARVGAQGIEKALKVLDPVIDKMLVAMRGMRMGLQRAVPPAALAGSMQVANRYVPPVAKRGGIPLAVSYGYTLTNGLPVDDGSEDKLCKEANKAVKDLIDEALSKVAFVGDVLKFLVNPVIDGMTAAGSSYFCGLGSGGQPPNMDEIINQQAKSVCNSEGDALKGEENTRRKDWLAACSKYSVTCIQPIFDTDDPYMAFPEEFDDTAAKNELTGLFDDYRIARNKRKAFRTDKCRNEKKTTMKKEYDENGKSQQTQSSSGKKNPAKVIDKWKNGTPDAQLLSVATGNRGILNRGLVGVHVGAQKKPPALSGTIPQSSRFSSAQAEFFYDCGGKWDSEACNADEEAMWNFRWRARLRRLEDPKNFGVMAPLKVAWTAETLTANKLSALSQFTGVGNANLKRELVQMYAGLATRGQDAVIH